MVDASVSGLGSRVGAALVNLRLPSRGRGTVNMLRPMDDGLAAWKYLKKHPFSQISQRNTRREIFASNVTYTIPFARSTAWTPLVTSHGPVVKN